MFVTDKPLENSLLFTRKARADLSGAPMVGSGLMHKHWNRLERPAKDKHFSLFSQFVSYIEKSYINSVDKVVQTFFVLIDSQVE